MTSREQAEMADRATARAEGRAAFLTAYIANPYPDWSMNNQQWIVGWLAECRLALEARNDT